MRWRIIPSNPIEAVDPPAVDAAEVRPYNAAEALRFLSAVKGHRFEARWMLAIMLGMRQGEVLGLAWNEVHLDQRTAYVRQGGSVALVTPFTLLGQKTARSRRTVPLPDQVVEALKLQKERQDRARDGAGEFWEK